MLHRTSTGCCEREIGMSKAHIPQSCEHGRPFKYVHGLERSEKGTSARKPRRAMKRGKGFAVAPKQREKVKGLPCVGCGAEANEWTILVDPAHLWPRGKGGCDDPLCVVPLCRLPDGNGCHRLFDEGRLDLLPRLIDGGYFPEIAHAIEAHQLSPLTLLERLTGSEWVERDKEFVDG
jgi:hypothetical protein